MTPWVARLLFLNAVMYVLTLVVPGLGDAGDRRFGTT